MSKIIPNPFCGTVLYRCPGVYSIFSLSPVFFNYVAWCGLLLSIVEDTLSSNPSIVILAILTTVNVC